MASLSLEVGVRSKANHLINQSDVSLPKLSSSIKLAAKLFPEIGNAQVIRCWSGIEGYLPDELPIIGRGRQNGLFHGFGFSAHGFQSVSYTHLTLPTMDSV